MTYLKENIDMTYLKDMSYLLSQWEAKKRRLLMLTLVFAFLFQNGAAQSCLPEGIHFSSQEEIDNFLRDYPDCTSIQGKVLIKETLSGNITNLNGLQNIKQFEGRFEIHNNNALTNLKGLDNLEVLGDGLNLYYNLALESLEGLNSLRLVTGSLRISSHPKLVDLKSLTNLKQVSEDLSIASNPILFDLQGLGNLEKVGGYFILSANKNIRTLAGLEKLESVGQSVLIQDNERLKEFSGIGELQTIGLHLIIENNKKLNSAHGFNKLSSVNGNLIIVENKELFDLNAFINLKSINGLLQILNNLNLISLSGLDSIDHQSIKNLAILSSFDLYLCQVESICNYLANDENLFSIKTNAKGCSTKEEILNACANRGTGQNTNLSKNEFIFFPNPTSEWVRVIGPGANSADLRIMDRLGRVLLTQKMTTDVIDLKAFPSGVYFLELQTKTRVVTGRVVKLSL